MKYILLVLVLIGSVIGILVYQNLKVPCTPVVVDLTTIEGQVIKECPDQKMKPEILKWRENS